MRPDSLAALPTPPSLAQAALAAARAGEPLVVMTTLKGCPYCDLVRQHHLLPLLHAGQIHAMQLDMGDRKTRLEDFDGKPTTPAERVSAWGAKLAPTVLFLGPLGRELAERLVGMAVPDFYGSYLEERLAQARAALRKGKS